MARTEHELLEDLAVLAWDADAATLEIVSVTGALARALGPGFKGAVERWTEAIAPTDRNPLLAACRAVVADGASREVEHRVLVDGATRHFRTRIARSSGTAMRLVALMTDVSSYKQREAALQHSEDLLATVLDQLPVVLFAVDRDGVIQVARGSGAVRLGPGAVGRSAFELFRDVPHVGENLRRALGGESVITEGRSDQVWWETRYVPLRGAGGEVAGVVGVTMDATARKRAEEQLVRANARLTELDGVKARFVANVSHELRTPLALVLGLTTRMRRSPALTEAQASDLAGIERNARLLLKHVEDLLDVARFDAGKVTPDYAEVDLAELVRLTASPFDVAAAERDVTLSVVAPEALPAAVDPDALQRIVLNLLSNAVKMTPAGGSVRCTLRQDARNAVVAVDDSGPGVPPSRREAIFERFVQLDRADDQRFGGTGLGLAIVRELVGLHGGTIAVGDAPEGGARFEVTLPLAPPAGTPVRARAEARGAGSAARDAATLLNVPTVPSRGEPLPGGAPRVLVVEDNPQMRRFMVETLSEKFAVDAAEDGEQGLARARFSRPSAVVTDLMMPRMAGDELVRALRAEPALADVPVIVLTARADDDLRVKLLKEGAQDYVLKPFGADELVARVANAVATKRARDVLARALESSSGDLAELAAQLVEEREHLRLAVDSTRAAREEAEGASSVKSAFLGMLSREILAPLSAVKAHAELLSRHGGVSEEARASAERIQSASARLVETVDSLLAHASVRAGRLTVRAESLDLGGLVRKVSADFAQRAESKGLTLHVTSSRGLAPATTDARLLTIVLSNLLDNAIKFSDQGSIRVEVGGDRHEHVVRITDTGRGIPAERRAEALDPPERAESTPSHGRGLGLTIVRHISDALGAHVDVSPRAEGGTIASLVLPRRGAEVEVPRTRQAG